MKKLFTISLITVSFLFQSLTGYAATPSNDYGIIMVIRPAKSSMLQTLLQTSLNLPETQQNYKDYQKAAIPYLIQSEEILFAFKNEDEGFATIKISESQYQNIINLGGYKDKSVYKDHIIYHYEDTDNEHGINNSYMSYTGNTIISSTNQQSIYDYIDKKLSFNTNMDPQSAIGIGINIDLLGTTYSEELKELREEDNVKQMVLELKQNSYKEFEIKVYMKYNQAPKDEEESDNKFDQFIENLGIKIIDIELIEFSETEIKTIIKFEFDWLPAINTAINKYLAAKTTYTDVEESAWYHNDIHSLKTYGIIEDSQYYRPSDNITRAEFVNMLVRYKKWQNIEPKNQPDSIFSDIAGNIYANDIALAYEMGLVNGDANSTTFRPNDSLNRAEAVKILAEASPTVDDYMEGMPTPFKDVPTNAWYKPYLEKAYGMGIVKGASPTEFKPDNKLNRAEAAALINRIYQLDYITAE